ncbi:hypothetical protein FRACYDRAFT_236328 [Fragilariopsis cylindrus CCMP1102]|uniref:Proteasome assembly chaperone 3 n=1 Tax=Fragilariopsis cylindrus CCMP1102 TaxID=635003 RepID=A0A1E7FQ77_9STRA|nr:hypothetical protein FRACYDRAFT_236328 [Fragilariopsis cylindrus CCMP1102]|eukprot:OEU20255.1 hypothetical protein FRACYDRAFT_236328 [Fragilariopsis cylindrus CCMP1102]
MSEESTPVPIAAAAAVAGSSSSSSSAVADSKTMPNISELLRSMTTKTTIETPTTTTTTLSGEDNNDTTTTTTTTTTITDPILTIAPQQKSPPLHRHVPSSLSLPKTISRSYLIYKIPTHMFCQIYNDRIVLGITQLSKSKGHIGSWVLCQSSKSEINPKNIDYELSTLLGNNNISTTSNNTAFDEKEIYSRRITERLLEKAIVVPRGIDKLTVLLGISLLPINSNSINSNPNPNNSKTKSTSTSTSEENDDFTSTFTSMERFKIIVEVLVELIEETASL